ncbi:MAG: glucuronate isomerase [Lentisphaeria bacterium]|jgi:glucuronate isomerase
MMRDDYLLTTATARRLYQAVAPLPVTDWHNHLSIEDLRTDRHYPTLTDLWITPDPYKHRAMRICGVPERLITGDADDYAKFLAWSATLAQLTGNPLQPWSAMELARVFGITRELTPDTAAGIWHEAQEIIAQPTFSLHGLLKRFNVTYAAPCIPAGDDPTALTGIDWAAPSLRGDDATTPTADTLERYSRLTGMAMVSFAAYAEAIRQRIEAFHRAGCRFADHAIDDGFRYIHDGREEESFQRLRTGEALSREDRQRLFSAILRVMATEYAQRNWVLQLHIGALRDTSSRLRRLVGPASGFAGIGRPCDIASIAALLDDLESHAGALPQTILYALNPADSTPLAVLSGSFPGDGTPGKVQLGPAWWYCDHLYGMRDGFETIAAYGVLSVFVGMTTDSRCPLSFVRHEYFRRAFCGWLGEKVEAGVYPDDFTRLQRLAVAVCGGNAAKMVQERKGT